MKEFVIVTDTTTDLPREYVEKHHLYMMSLPYTLEVLYRFFSEFSINHGSAYPP